MQLASASISKQIDRNILSCLYHSSIAYEDKLNWKGEGAEIYGGNQ